MYGTLGCVNNCSNEIKTWQTYLAQWEWSSSLWATSGSGGTRCRWSVSRSHWALGRGRRKPTQWLSCQGLACGRCTGCYPALWAEGRPLCVPHQLRPGGSIGCSRPEGNNDPPHKQPSSLHPQSEWETGRCLEKLWEPLKKEVNGEIEKEIKVSSEWNSNYNFCNVLVKFRSILALLF